MQYFHGNFNCTVSSWRALSYVYLGQTGECSSGQTVTLVLVVITFIVVVYRWDTSPPPKLPIYAPLEIAITGLCFSLGGTALKLRRSLRKYGGSLFGIFDRHQVVYNLPNAEKLLSQPYHVLDNHPVDWTMFTRIFGASKHEDLGEKLKLAKKELFGAVERVFLSEIGASNAVLRANIPDQARRLVTLTNEDKDRSLWERSARVQSKDESTVEADLMSLMRDFGACVAIPLLYGQDFLQRYPQCLADLWDFDHNCFPLLMIGFAEWVPIKAFQDGLSARRRLIEEIKGLYRRIEQYQTGTPVDGGVDMGDVSEIALSRSLSFQKHGFSSDHRGITDFALLWGQNGNTQPIVFWFTLFMYSTPGLLPALRQEVAAHVKTDGDVITSFSYEGIYHESPLLKSTLYETFRIVNDPASLRYVAKPLTIPDGKCTHKIRAGTWISVLHSTCQKDPSIFPSPKTFVPDRFIDTDQSTGEKIARYGKLKPWGAGVGMCKGRTFAEKEILCIGAAVVSLWDISPAEGKTWMIPDTRPGTGVMRPAYDVRVRITRKK